MKAKGFIGEFRDFISRGNVMDMAVGVLIGGAFSSIVTSLTEDIISPILGLFGGMNFDQLSVNILGEVTLNYGKFITAVVNFLLMALIIFLMLKGLNALQAKAAKLAHLAAEKEETPAEPSVKTCPYCLMEIPIGAVRCGHCTSELETESDTAENSSSDTLPKSTPKTPVME